MEIKVLEAEIMRGNIHSTYLVVGADAPRRHQAVRLLEEALCPPDVREWCLVKVDGEEASGAEVRDLVSTPPFLGERRVVVVKDAEKLADAEALVPYVEDPPGFSVLILTAESVDRRQRLLRAIEKHGLVLAYDPPKDGDLYRRVREMATDLGLRFESQAVAALLEKAGDDLERIEQELRKLSAYAAPGEVVGREQVEALVAEGPTVLGQYEIFEYVDAITEGQSALALQRLARLIAAGEPPLLVLAMIARQLRLLLAAIAWRGERPEAMAQALGMKSSYPAKKAMAQAGTWSVEQLAEALEACARCDAAIKRGMDGPRALELLTIQLAEGRKGARRRS